MTPKDERAQALAELRALLPPGTTVYTTLGPPATSTPSRG